MKNTPEIERLQAQIEHLAERAAFFRHNAENAKRRDYNTYGFEATCQQTRELEDKAENAEKRLRDTERELAKARHQEKNSKKNILQALMDTDWKEQTEQGNTPDLTPKQVETRERLEKLYQPKIDACIAAVLANDAIAQSEQGQRILNGLRTPGSVIYAAALKRFIQKRIGELELELQNHHTLSEQQNIQQFLSFLKNHPPLTYHPVNNILNTLLEKVQQPENTIAQKLLRKFGDKNES